MHPEHDPDVALRRDQELDQCKAVHGRYDEAGGQGQAEEGVGETTYHLGWAGSWIGELLLSASFLKSIAFAYLAVPWGALAS